MKINNKILRTNKTMKFQKPQNRTISIIPGRVNWPLITGLLMIVGGTYLIIRHSGEPLYLPTLEAVTRHDILNLLNTAIAMQHDPRLINMVGDANTAYLINVLVYFYKLPLYQATILANYAVLNDVSVPGTTIVQLGQIFPDQIGLIQSPTFVIQLQELASHATGLDPNFSHTAGPLGESASLMANPPAATADIPNITAIDTTTTAPTSGRGS